LEAGERTFEGRVALLEVPLRFEAGQVTTVWPTLPQLKQRLFLQRHSFSSLEKGHRALDNGEVADELLLLLQFELWCSLLLFLPVGAEAEDEVAAFSSQMTNIRWSICMAGSQSVP
jgi:hypothetical protein